MSSKKRELVGAANNSKKAKVDDGTPPDFVSDGLDNESIRTIVRDIRSIIQENAGKKTHANIVNSISEDAKFKFFTERYPMLFDMVTKEVGFDFDSLEYFLSMRGEIINNNITSEEASKEVGQAWFDKFYKEPK
jgi:hypothetical protein